MILTVCATGLLAGCSGAAGDDAPAEAAASSELRSGAERLTRNTWVREICQARSGNGWQVRGCSTGREQLRFAYPNEDNEVDDSGDALIMRLSYADSVQPGVRFYCDVGWAAGTLSCHVSPSRSNEGRTVTTSWFALGGSRLVVTTGNERVTYRTL